MKRPEITNEIIRVGVSQFTTDHSEYFEDGSEDYQGDLVDAYQSYDDGYRLMKELEDYHHWDGSLELANILDYLPSYVDKAYKQQISEWMKEHNIQPPYPIGHKFNDHGRPAQITGIDTYDSYRYLVQYLDDGDCKLGGNGSRIFWFDQIVDE